LKLRGRIAAAIALLAMLSGCSRYQGGGSASPPAAGIPQSSLLATVPLGQIAGGLGGTAALSTPNPYQGNPQAIEQGKQLYVKMNCAGCHAYNGKGNMGPDLTDAYWRYGGLPVQIYNTILEGRPQGMPAWGKALTPDEIWKLVAYIQSLGGAQPAADWNHARQGDQAGEGVAPEAAPEAAGVKP
jgi:cytochrome c oxidase cbb3-type subunit 3